MYWLLLIKHNCVLRAMARGLELVPAPVGWGKFERSRYSGYGEWPEQSYRGQGHI